MKPAATPSQGQDTSTRIFHHFQLLPLELQLNIWRCSLPCPQIADVFAIPISEKLQQRLSSNACNSDPNSGTWVRTFTERVYCTPQPLLQLLHVSHQTRDLVLQCYSKIAVDDGTDSEKSVQTKEPFTQPNGVEIIYSREVMRVKRPFALVDPKRDILFLEDPQMPAHFGSGSIVSSLSILVRWIEHEIILNLRRLAIPYYSWRKCRITETLTVLKEFKGLTELYVSFMGGYEPGSTWSDGIGELAGHMDEAEAEVKADLENLERGSRGWQRPKLKFVKHRGVIIAGNKR